MPQQFKVVLADDDADDRDLFTEALSLPNISVHTVNDGVALLAFLESHKDALPDCIFLDLNMPLMGGKQCLQEIRANNAFRDIPVVMYSTSSNMRDIQETLALGANLYVIKLSSYAKLQATLQRVVSLDWKQHPPMAAVKNYVFST